MNHRNVRATGRKEFVRHVKAGPRSAIPLQVWLQISESASGATTHMLADVLLQGV